MSNCLSYRHRILFVFTRWRDHVLLTIIIIIIILLAREQYSKQVQMTLLLMGMEWCLAACLF